jgi:hypothetical protein
MPSGLRQYRSTWFEKLGESGQIRSAHFQVQIHSAP